MKNGKGKIKSEKVWRSLLFTLSLVFFTSAAWADNAKLVAENVRVEQAKRLYDEWVARLRASAYIKVYP